MSRIRKLVLSLMVVVLLAVGVAAYFVLTFDANRYRGLILSQLSQAVNRPVEAADLELQLFPLRLRLNQVLIPEDPGFTGEDFLRARSVQFEFSLWSFLRGQPQVLALELDQATLFVRSDEAGRWNVASLAAASEEEAPSGAPVRNWALREGTLVIATHGREPLRLTGVEAALFDLDPSRSFPFQAAISFSPESRLSAEGRLGPLNPEQPSRTPVTAEVSLVKFRPTALSTVVELPSAVAGLREIEGTLNVRATTTEMTLEGRLVLPGGSEGEDASLQFSAVVPPQWNRMELREANLKSAGARITGSGSFDFIQEAPRFDLVLSTSDADLDGLKRLPPRLGWPLPENVPPVSGKLTAALKLAGTPEAWQLTGAATGRDLNLPLAQLPEPLRIPAVELSFTPTRLSAEPFTASIGEQFQARVNFRLENYSTRPTLSANLATEAASLEALLNLARSLGTDPLPGGQARGRITTAIDLNGRLGEEAPPLTLRGQATLLQASVQPAALAGPIRVDRAELEFTPNNFSLSNARLVVAGTTAQGSLRVDDFDAPRTRFNLRGDIVDTEKLQALFAAPARQPRSAGGLLPVVHAQEKQSDWFARVRGSGRLQLDQVRHGTLTLAPFAAPVTIQNQTLTCNPLEFGFYDGGGRGRLVFDLRGSEPTTEFEGLFRGVDANKLLSANSESKNLLHGRLGGTLSVRFTGSERQRATQSATGKGQLTLVNGRLAHVNLSRVLVTLGQLAGFPLEGRDTPIEDMMTDFTIGEGWVRTDNLTLRTADLTMTAVGGFNLQDELAFEATAVLTPEASRRLASRNPLGSLTGKVLNDEQGRTVIPFLIRGTFAKPKFSLDTRRLLEKQLRRGRGAAESVLDILDHLRKKPEPPQ